MGEWQPIETAPKDGAPVLVAQDQMVGSAWWDDKFETRYDNEIDELVYRGAWTNGMVASWGYEKSVELHPTHWMPLSAPPPCRASRRGASVIERRVR